MYSKKISWLAGIFLMALTVSAQEQAPRITSISHDALRLGPVNELKAPNNDKIRYGVIFPFQVGPNMAAAFVNRGVYTANWNYDFEDGSDLFLFDDVNKLQAQNAIRLNRSGVEPDPDYGGKKRYFNRFPVVGGFVPYGAKVNNQPHPHAGTGFGISQVLTFPVAPNGTFSWESSPIDRKIEIFQFTYDGKKIQVISKEVKTSSNPFQVPNSKWTILSGGICMAIPDGNDLLFPAWAENGNGECSGISRWSRINGSWKVVSFIPVAYSKPKQHNYYEPSLIRDKDGSLIFAARDDGRQNIKNPSWGTAQEQDINAWRSLDGGINWTQIIHVEQVRTAPMSIGRSVGGTPFIICNPIIKDKPAINYNCRDLMYLWPLNSQRNALVEPLVVRDAAKEFGKNNSNWYIDHPNSNILRLADGKIHAFLAYRVRDTHVINSTKGTSEPSAHAGSYLEEVIGTGTPCPVWQFE